MDVNEIMPRQCLLTPILCALLLVMFTGQFTFTSQFASQPHRAQIAELSECRYAAERELLSASIAEHCPDQQPDNDLSCPVVCTTSCSAVQASLIQPHRYQLLPGSADFGALYADKVLAASFKPLLRPPIG